MQEHLKLDYSIQSPQQRVELVHKIVNSFPPEKLTNRFLEILADYIIFAMTKAERKNREINTDNRMVTINKRETSFQGLVSKFENGEDGIYNMIINDKNVLLTPKISITQQDLEEIPHLRELRAAIEELEKVQKKACGKRKFLLKKQLIQMRQDQYVIKMAYKQPISCLNAIRNFNTLVLNQNIVVSNNGSIEDNSLISLMNPEHVSALLCNYSALKEESYGKFYTDGYYIIQDLETLIDSMKEKHPLYFKLLVYKIDNKKNIEIQQLLEKEYNIKYSVEYISSLWRNKIPTLLAKKAQQQYLEWFYLQKQRGIWKKCSRCGQIKLAHNIFFSKNTSSKSGFYSICKECRNKKKSKKDKSNVIIKRIKYKKEES